MIDPNDKDTWVDNADEEAEFVNIYGKDIGAILNPAKIFDTFAADLYSYRYDTLADLKVQREPYRTSGNYGVKSEFCVTLNVMDIIRYGSLHGGRFLIYFWLQHPNNPQNGVYCTSIKRLYDSITKRRRQIHAYQTRNGADGNKTHSFVLDINDLTKVQTTGESNVE